MYLSRLLNAAEVFMSQMTKRALEASLKKLLLQKPLNKITISDIAEDCGISRMTFYYHFKDIYDLVEWVCVEDAARALAGKKTYDTWQEALRQVRTSHEFVLSFFTRAVNILPSDVLSLYMGAIGIHYIKYLTGSILGMALPIVTFPIMGTNIADPISPAFLIPFAIQIAVSVVSIISCCIYRKKNKKEAAYDEKENRNC